MLEFRSDERQVIAAADTGGGVSDDRAVIEYVRLINGICHISNVLTRDASTVTTVLIAPSILATPFRCGAEIARSTATLACPTKPLNGG